MTDKQYEKTKQRTEKFIKKWQGAMGLRWWKIECYWSRDISDEAPGRAAETNMNRWQYRDADITFYAPMLLNLKDDELEELVVHELTHVLLSPISVNMEKLNDDYQHDIMEFNTTIVAQALLWVREEGEDDGKKSANRSK